MKGIKYTPVSQVIAKLSKKYNANKCWLWDLVEEEYNYIRGLGCVMNPLEIQEFEYLVKSQMEE